MYSTMKGDLPMLAIRLPAEVEERLARLAKTTGRTKSYYVREAVIEYLAELEDVYLAERRLEEIRAGRVQTVPLSKLMKQHGLED